MGGGDRFHDRQAESVPPGVADAVGGQPAEGLEQAGATRGQFRPQFLSESVLLSVLGGLAGAGLGGAVTCAYATSRSWTVVVPPISLAAAIGAALVIGGMAGLYPAVRAARLAPTDALRSV